MYSQKRPISPQKRPISLQKRPISPHFSAEKCDGAIWAHAFPVQPIISTKETHTSTKETHISTKETYFSTLLCREV